jgi:vesicle coat complex subunit
MIELKIHELTLSNNHSLFNTFSVSYFAYLKFYVAISCNCNVWLAIRHTLTCVHDVAFSKIIFVQLHNSRREQVNYQLDDDEVRFVLDQPTELDFYSASSLKQVCG